MRRAPTYAERSLGKALRQTSLHFRRQAPFGPYIVDFVCRAHRLIVEVDGGIHRLADVAARDLERETWLTVRGYTVMRIPNEQAVAHPYAVAEMVLARVSVDTPTPDLSPQGGGERTE